MQRLLAMFHQYVRLKDLFPFDQGACPYEGVSLRGACPCGGRVRARSLVFVQLVGTSEGKLVLYVLYMFLVAAQVLTGFYMLTY